MFSSSFVCVFSHCCCCCFVGVTVKNFTTHFIHFLLLISSLKKRIECDHFQNISYISLFSSIISECLNWMSARVSTNNRKHFRVITTKYETELFRNVFCCCERFLSFWVQLSIFWLLCFSNKKMVNAWSGGCWSGNTCFMSLLLSQKSTYGFHDLDYFCYRTEINKSGIKPFEVFASGSFQLKRIKFTT